MKLSTLSCISFMQQLGQLGNQTSMHQGAGVLWNQQRFQQQQSIPPFLPQVPSPSWGANQCGLPPNPFATTGIVQPLPGPYSTVIPGMQGQWPAICPSQSNVVHSTSQNQNQRSFPHTVPKASNYWYQHFK